MKRLIVNIILLISFLSPTYAQTWHDMEDFELFGSLAADATMPYTRFPDEFKGKIRDNLWALGQNSAGLSIRFATDATDIYAKWTSLNAFRMNHMCPTGIRGLDLYVLMPDNTWEFVGSARPSTDAETKKATIISGMSKKMREYMLFLSLYDGVKDLSIGTNPGAKFTDANVDLPIRELPVVMYGTSILQGGCASRPGMAHTNILQRMLNREVVNLGFSGNAHLDPEIAHLMADTDASLYVIDVVPNNTVKSLNEKLEPFYRILRQKHPTTPILLVENPVYSRKKFDSNYQGGIDSLNNALKAFYNRMLDQNDFNLYYFDGEDILGVESEGTVDAIHFTDLGFQHFAESLYPIINALITE